MSTAKRNEVKTPPWGGDPASSSLSFGTWLRQQREVREIGLREIADSTKISMRYLEAFEQDRFDLLPARVFSRGFLRQFAGYVGLDPEEVVNNFIWAQKALEPDGEDEASEAPDESRDSPPWLMIIVILLLLAALVVALIYWRSSDDSDAAVREPFLPPTTGAIASPVPAANTPAERTRQTATDLDVVGASTEGPRDGASTGGPTGGPVDQESAMAGLVTATAAELAMEATETEVPPSQAVRRAAEASTAPLRVTLEFEQDCWVEISVDNGRRRISQTYQATQAEFLEARRIVLLRKLGNAGGVRVRVNGLPMSLEAAPGQVLSNVRIDLETARNLESLANPGAGA